MAKNQLHKAVADGVKVYCNYDEIVSVTDLKPNPENPNRHPAEQIELLAKIIQKNGWRERIIVSTLSGMIVKGHGRYQAAIRAGLGKVPVEYQYYETKADEIKDLIADNKIAELSEVDDEMAAEMMRTIDNFIPCSSMDLSEFGYGPDNLEILFPELSNTPRDGYSRNIEAPIYMPRGNKPEIKDLFNDQKTVELIAEIKSSNIPEDIKEFLFSAARRHTVFHYDRIAEFYSHSGKEIQLLMENSALVIIDFNRAIELGYVKLSEEVANQYGKDYPDD